MRNKSTLFAILLMVLTILFLLSCHAEDDYQNAYYYQTSQELKAEIRKGIKLVPIEEERTFYRLYDQVMEMCNSDKMGIISNAYIYLQQPEYEEFKDFFNTTASDESYYLLIDKYMLCEHGVFPYMVVDIMEDKFPGLRDLAELRAIAYYTDHYEAFPSIYVQMLVEELNVEEL